MRSKFALSCLGAALLPTLSWGHHSFAMFDQVKTVALSGTLKEIQWVNPHSWIQVVAKDDSGNDVEWSIECGGPAQLYRAGWRKSAIKDGDAITIYMHPLRDGRPGGSLVSATLADGTKLGDGGRAPPAPGEAAASAPAPNGG